MPPMLDQVDVVIPALGWTIEMQIKAARAKLRIREIPVPYRKRVGTSKTSGRVSRTIRAGAKILFTIARYGLQRFATAVTTPDSNQRSNQAIA